MPLPLPAGTSGGNALRQTGMARAPLLVSLALLALLGVQLFQGGAALLDAGSLPEGQADVAVSPASGSRVDLDSIIVLAIAVEVRKRFAEVIELVVVTRVKDRVAIQVQEGLCAVHVGQDY